MSVERVVRQWRHTGQQWREILVDLSATPVEIAEMVARKRAESSWAAELEFIVEVNVDGVTYMYGFRTRRTIEVVLI